MRSRCAFYYFYFISVFFNVASWLFRWQISDYKPFEIFCDFLNYSYNSSVFLLFSLPLLISIPLFNPDKLSLPIRSKKFYLFFFMYYAMFLLLLATSYLTCFLLNSFTMSFSLFSLFIAYGCYFNKYYFYYNLYFYKNTCFTF